MALIKCSECGRDVSDSAASCPNCGHPISFNNKTVVQLDSAPQKRKKYRVGILIFGLMFVVGSIFSMIWGFSAITGGEGGQFGFWFFVAAVGFIGMIASAIGSWLSKP